MAPLRATVNCDMGEGFSLYRIADDEALMKTIHLANIACGFHASDFSIMNATVAHAKTYGVSVGAHPSLPDRQGFGRREMAIEPDELLSCFVYQIGALAGFLKLHGLPLNHVKPHGAIYGQTARSLPLARSVVAAAKAFSSDESPVAFMGLAGTFHQTACEEAGVKFIAEWFADLDYDSAGKLLITKVHSPVTLEVIRERVTRLLVTHQITTDAGTYLPLPNVTEVSICCHSDTPGAVEIAQFVKSLVDESNNRAGQVSWEAPGLIPINIMVGRYLTFSSMQHKLLAANRGEIALRILRTAKAAGIATVAIYSPSDAQSPHVTFADEAFPLDSSGSMGSEAESYLSGDLIVSICREHAVTLVHPGYGFLSENAAFAEAVRGAHIIWLGPEPSVIQTMGRKHLARGVAMQADVPCVPGSEGLVPDEQMALDVAARIGLPVMVKASAGGGGMGMVICEDENALLDAFVQVKKRAEVLFNDDAVFLERYFPTSRHIEVQIFGNGQGDVICLGERECNIQRRHQKIIEETPSPFLETRPELRTKMHEAAVRLAKFVKYGSAGTVEFLVDNESGDFFFLEMNTRIQVEHAITEAVHPGLDLVKLMILQGLAEAKGLLGLSACIEMQQSTYDALLEKGNQIGSNCSIEARVYAENPAAQFRPCPGILQYVDIPSDCEWLRVDTWISTGTTVTPFFDPLLAKIIVTAPTRLHAISRLRAVLEDTQIQGPTNNIEYLKGVLSNTTFQSGHATTTFLTTFEYCPRGMTVLAAAVELTVQDFPGRDSRIGIPRSGPMDSIAFRAANSLVNNPVEMEGLEMIVLPGCPSTFRFHVPVVVSITGKDVSVRVNSQDMDMWSAVVVPAGGELSLSSKPAMAAGWRTYLAVRGGFPRIPTYLGSKSTSMGLGGFQGRSLVVGDELALATECGPTEIDSTGITTIPIPLLPVYPSHFIVHVLAGPQDDEEFVTAEGISKFYGTRWQVSPSSNRLGIRLENTEKIIWARPTGGAGGSHPSNILDNGYAIGSVNLNGDTPVLFTQESPDMGGYVCLCTVVSADMWKVGQLYPGCTLEFRRVSWNDAMTLYKANTRWLQAIRDADVARSPDYHREMDVNPNSSKLLVRPGTPTKPLMVLRQAGDSAILIEYGEMRVDFYIRARIHALETQLKGFKVHGILAFCPCIRSTMCYYDPLLISQADVLASILRADSMISDSMEEMIFPGRRLTFPIVLDDQWSRKALERYMTSIRDKAVYLPSNVDYLARNNGFNNAKGVLEKLMSSDWLVFGVGFYLACPFLIPIDPRCRIVAQKMNPSRTYTPQGAVGIAGVVAAIYPIVSPGGYMLFGRTLPAWQQWGKGADFAPDRPWLLQPFDQVHFEPVTEEQYIQIEKQFIAGQYRFEIEETEFSMTDYSTFSASVAEEVARFEAQQAQSVADEETKEKYLLENWEQQKKADLKPAALDRNAVRQGSAFITSPLLGNIWKMCVRPGDTIVSADTTVVIMEAMKTEIPVKAGDAHVGKKVLSWGEGVQERSTVGVGDILIVLS